MKKIILYTLVSCLCLLPEFMPVVFNHGVAFAQDEWKQEYEAVCAQTQDAMSLSVDELTNYIERCDKLQDRIDELDGSQGSARKVYGKRLKMCRDLYQFALDFKNQKK